MSVREGPWWREGEGGKANDSADTTEHCGQWDVVTYNQYSLLLDQWGKDNAESGQTCASITSANGDTIAVSRLCFVGRSILIWIAVDDDLRVEGHVGQRCQGLPQPSAR